MVAGSREYRLFWDSTMANPNGDMLNENQPRKDIKTGQLEVSEVRIKRFVRDEWDAMGQNILVQTTTNEAGKVLSCATRIAEIAKGDNAKKEKIEDKKLKQYLLDNYIDVRLFGAVITKPKHDITGPLQVTWSRSVHVADIKFMQGNAAYASGEGKAQSSIWSKYITPYALFKTYAVYNSKVAEREGAAVTEDDLDNFTKALIYGLINYRSTSKNQMPRVLVEVIYKEHMVDGEFDYVDVSYDCPDLELRNISQFKFDLSRLQAYCASKKDVIKEVRLYMHNSVKIGYIPKGFKIINI